MNVCSLMAVKPVLGRNCSLRLEQVENKDVPWLWMFTIPAAKILFAPKLFSV